MSNQNQLIKNYPYDNKLKMLKKLPKNFTKEFIYNTIKRIFPHVTRHIDEQNQKWTMTVITNNRKQIDNIELQFIHDINTTFNLYILKKLGNPKEYDRSKLNFLTFPKGNILKIETF